MQYIVLHKDLSGTDKTWPSMRAPHQYWEQAAQYIKEISQTPYTRGQLSVRQRTQLHLAKEFKTVEEAECYVGLNVDLYLTEEPGKKKLEPKVLEPHSSVLNVIKHLTQDQLQKCINESFQKLSEENKHLCTKHMLDEFCTQIKHPELVQSLLLNLSVDEQMSLVNMLLSKIASVRGIISNIGKFATLSLIAMKRLQDLGKTNLIYKFSRAIAEDRPGTNDPLMPLTRMPFGLIQYNIEFFTSTNVHQVINTFITYTHSMFFA